MGQGKEAQMLTSHCSWQLRKPGDSSKFPLDTQEFSFLDKAQLMAIQRKVNISFTQRTFKLPLILGLGRQTRADLYTESVGPAWSTQSVTD